MNFIKKPLFLRKLVFFSAILFLFASCDDGDIIVTTFEFDDTDFQLCRGAKENEFVFFKINTELNEAISYNFINPVYSDSIDTTEPILINLESGDNALVYRQFNTGVEDSYYCNNVPDSDITVTSEYRSIKGTAEINVTIVEENDNDNVPALDDDATIDPIAIEDLNGDGDPDNDDTDNDGIPNYKDQDDDNDNILTSAELSNGIASDDSYRDTDDDGIPNYLDADDDNDGILTKDEDLNNNGNPRDDDYDGDQIFDFEDDDDDGDGILTKDEDANGDGDPRNDDSDGDMIPNYLDTDTATDVMVALGDRALSISNTITTTYRTELLIFNLEFSQNSDQFEDDFFDFGFMDVNKNATTPPNNNE